MAFTITPEQFQAFHTIDRRVYARLVIVLRLDPCVSKKIVAFWNWLETICNTYFVNEMQQVEPDALLNAFAHEAIICINCMNHEFLTLNFIDNDRVIPLTRSLVSQNFSLGLVYDNRENAICKIDKFIKEVCDKAFYDIVPNNLANGVQSLVPYNESLVLNGRNAANRVQSLVPYNQSLALNGRNAANVVQPWVPHSESLVLNGRNVANVVQPWVPYSESLVLNGRNAANVVQSWVPNSESLVLNGRNVSNGVQSSVPRSEYIMNNGQILVPPSESQSQFSRGLQDNECHSQMETNQAAADVARDLSLPVDRTLFISFSEGHTIKKQELKDFITRNYGDCVLAVHMHIHLQPIFAHVIVRSSSVLEEILGDNEFVQFSINGKDAWARLFFSKGVMEQLPLH